MKSIAVMSGKGGVGKSTVSANLAAKLANEGKNVGVLDSDFHGPTMPKLFGVKGGRLGSTGKEEIKPVKVNKNLEVVSMDLIQGGSSSPVMWRGPLKMNMLQDLLDKVKWNDIDYLIVDLPPGTGDESLSIAQQMPNINGALIVTTPQEVSVQSVRKSIKFAKEVDMPILGLIENMSGFICPNCGKSTDIFGTGGGQELADEVDIKFLGSVPLDPKIVESGENSEPFVLENNKSSIAFEDIVEKIQNQLKNQDD